MSLALNVDAVSSLIVEVGKAEVLPRFQKLGDGAIRVKSQPGDLVTDADIASEKALTPALLALLPGSTVVGEEATFADNSLLDRIAGDAPVWIIDPIDGTANFASGTPRFGMIVALTLAGETIAGWLHDPITGVMVTAERGAGAWSAGQRLTVGASGRALSSLILSAPSTVKRSLKGVVAKEIRNGSAAHDYMQMVTGKLDIAVFTKMMPWDHAAGLLINREAGGTELLTDGRTYTPMIHEGTFVAASDEETCRAIVSHIV